jgi:ribosomal protein L22
VINQQMHQAYSLIQQKRYDDARSVLRAVDHLTAKRWLQHLDKIDPPTVEAPRIDADVHPTNVSMNEAYKLIQQKRYDEARAILGQIDHLTAKRWLQHLNRITAQANSR